MKASKGSTFLFKRKCRYILDTHTAWPVVDWRKVYILRPEASLPADAEGSG